jgi:hypothetical protein
VVNSAEDVEMRTVKRKKIARAKDGEDMVREKRNKRK